MFFVEVNRQVSLYKNQSESCLRESFPCKQFKENQKEVQPEVTNFMATIKNESLQTAVIAKGLVVISIEKYWIILKMNL